ncbi:MAG: hypothetical protein C4321_07235, partial [Chloroflexota bacterium]
MELYSRILDDINRSRSTDEGALQRIETLVKRANAKLVHADAIVKAKSEGKAIPVAPAE